MGYIWALGHLPWMTKLLRRMSGADNIPRLDCGDGSAVDETWPNFLPVVRIQANSRISYWLPKDNMCVYGVILKSFQICICENTRLCLVNLQVTLFATSRSTTHGPDEMVRDLPMVERFRILRLTNLEIIFVSSIAENGRFANRLTTSEYIAVSPI